MYVLNLVVPLGFEGLNSSVDAANKKDCAVCRVRVKFHKTDERKHVSFYLCPTAVMSGDMRGQTGWMTD
jgi:hypothetical protein